MASASTSSTRQAITAQVQTSSPTQLKQQNVQPRPALAKAAADVAGTVFKKQLTQLDIDSRALLKGLNAVFQLKKWLLGTSNGKEVYISQAVSQDRCKQYQELAKKVERTFSTTQSNYVSARSNSLYASLTVPTIVVDKILTLPTSMIDEETKSSALEYLQRDIRYANLRGIVTIGNQHFLEYTTDRSDNLGVICEYQEIEPAQISTFASHHAKDPHVRQPKDATSPVLVAKYSSMSLYKALIPYPAGAFIISEDDTKPGTASLKVARKIEDKYVIGGYTEEYPWKWDGGAQLYSTEHSGQTLFAKNTQEIAAAVTKWEIIKKTGFL